MGSSLYITVLTVRGFDVDCLLVPGVHHLIRALLGCPQGLASGLGLDMDPEEPLFSVDLLVS